MGRIEYLDAIKGFAIILVVFGHVLAWNFTDLNTIMHPVVFEDIRFGLVWNLIYSFHMALFFMVSGYLTNLDNKSKFQFIKKKTHRLLVPYITTGFLILIVRGHYGYWFFLSLFELFLMVAFVEAIYKLLKWKRNAIIDVTIAFVLWMLLYILHKTASLDTIVGDFGKFISYYPPFMLGYFMRKYPNIFGKLVLRRNYSFYLIVFIVMFAFHYSYLVPLPIIMGKILITISGIMIQIVGSLLVFSIFNRFSITTNVHEFYGLIHNRLSMIGQYSMDIYILHILFVMTIPQIEKFMRNSLDFMSTICFQIIYSSFFAAFAILMSIIIAKIIRNSNCLNRLILGN